MMKEYKGHKINMDEHTGKFSVVVNGGLRKSCASLKQAQNAIDKANTVTFEPKEVLVIKDDRNRYTDPTVYSVKKVKITDYREEKGYGRRGGIVRKLIVEGYKEMPSITLSRWNATKTYPLSALEKLTELCVKRTEQEKIAHEAEEKGEKLSKKMEELAVSYDPHPDTQ